MLFVGGRHGDPKTVETKICSDSQEQEQEKKKKKKEQGERRRRYGAACLQLQ